MLALSTFYNFTHSSRGSTNHTTDLSISLIKMRAVYSGISMQALNSWYPSGEAFDYPHLLRARLKNRLDGDSRLAANMIHALDVDTSAARPDGRDRQENQALPV